MSGRVVLILTHGLSLGQEGNFAAGFVPFFASFLELSQNLFVAFEGSSRVIDEVVCKAVGLGFRPSGGPFAQHSISKIEHGFHGSDVEIYFHFLARIIYCRQHCFFPTGLEFRNFVLR